MAYSNREVTAHVMRRLGIGAHPDVVGSVANPEEAIDVALDLSEEPQPVLDLPLPRTVEEARDPSKIAEPISWWVERMAKPARIVEERMVWFWTDHFAMSLRKVPFPYLHWEMHKTIRRFAMGSFSDLLHAVAIEPAMLFYLDGINNEASHPNENFAREVMELYTMGVGHYTQTDVVEAARAFTGWVVNVPGHRRLQDVAGSASLWESFLVPFRHDDGHKTLLGSYGTLDLTAAIEIMLEQPETSRFVSSKIYAGLVGFPPPPSTADRLGEIFASNYSTIELVHEITSDPAFLSEAAIRSKVRTPLERLVAVIQGFNGAATERASIGLRLIGYVPFLAPNPAGYPSGQSLLGPYQLTHAFDLLGAIHEPPDLSPEDTLARLGIHDVSPETSEVIARAGDPGMRIALAANSPEFALV